MFPEFVTGLLTMMIWVGALGLGRVYMWQRRRADLIAVILLTLTGLSALLFLYNRVSHG